MYDITSSIVLYENEEEVVKKAINSFLNTDLNVKLYLVDNSSTDRLKTLKDIDEKRIDYIFNNANLGFGKAHNIVIRKIIDKSKYHLVLNPDVWFEKGNLEKMYNYMEQHPEIGQLMPKVLNPDRSFRYVCKSDPTPFDLILRRFCPNKIKNIFKKKLDAFENRNKDYNSIMDAKILSGAFMFIKNEVFKEVGLFDERFFMYFEDFDFSKRIRQKYKLIYYPNAQVFHLYGGHSYKNKRLLFIHIVSAIKYFNKWGWNK